MSQEQEQAIAYFRHKLQHSPDNASHHQNLAPLLAAQGNIKGALHHCRLAVQLNEHDVKSKNDMGLYLMQLGKWEAALAAFTQAVKAQPSFVAAHVNISALLYSRGIYDVALRHARTAVALSPTDASLHRNLARLLAANHRSAESIVHNKIAIHRGPGAQTPPVAYSRDIATYRALGMQLQCSGQSKAQGASGCIDVARALEGKRVVLPQSATTYEMLAKAKITGF
eukprot:13615-Heterococcus_DN1.PRE.4